MSQDLQWKVIYVASRQEKKVFDRLKKEGIAVFLPLTKKLRQWSDRKKWVEFPLFNGYLFVKPTSIQRDEILEINRSSCLSSVQWSRCYCKRKRDTSDSYNSGIRLFFRDHPYTR